jgi:hypothetical protein
LSLDPSAHSILRAVFGMGLLSFLMFFWMSLTRLPAMKRAGLTLSDAKHTEERGLVSMREGERLATTITTSLRRLWSSTPHR